MAFQLNGRSSPPILNKKLAELAKREATDPSGDTHFLIVDRRDPSLSDISRHVSPVFMLTPYLWIHLSTHKRT